MCSSDLHLSAVGPVPDMFGAMPGGDKIYMIYTLPGNQIRSFGVSDADRLQLYEAILASVTINSLENNKTISLQETDQSNGNEVINGITVPPEPDRRTNRVTLAGVDSNRNGVRDDVERKIARLSRSPAEGATILLGAAAYQRLVLLPNSPEPTRMQLLQIFSDVTCSQWAVAQARGVYDKSLVYERDLLPATLNTPERLADFEDKLQNFSGYLGTELKPCI